VRELGGSLLILGGDRAFAAGGYVGTPLDALSPLSSAPPRPTTHWIFLADASGSMAAPSGADGSTRWRAASAVLISVIPLLPPDDLLSVASFARELGWWRSSQTVRDVLANLADLPPRDVLPQGPTNLEAALDQIAQASRDKMPTELMVITDGDATIAHVQELAEKLRTHRVRVHLLSTAPLGTDAPLRSIVAATGGRVVGAERCRALGGRPQTALAQRIADPVGADSGARQVLRNDELAISRRGTMEPNLAEGRDRRRRDGSRRRGNDGRRRDPPRRSWPGDIGGIRANGPGG
jgi:hypothetical protein